MRGVTFQPVQDAGRNESFDKSRRVVLSESGPAPDLVVETSPDVLNAVARGETNLNTAVMSGRIKLHGDMALLLVLRAMIDGTSAGQPA